MCQLMFTDLKNAELNKLLLYYLLLEDSKFSHKDGFGFCVGNPGNPIAFKSKLTPGIVTNLGIVLDYRIKTASPVMGHVRLASIGQKFITDENAHPFFMEHLILAHNGTLEFKDHERKYEPQYKDKIDSEIFAMVLNEEYAKDFDMVRALNSAYENFCGKFAFTIWSRHENKFYIVRGLQAKLYKSKITLPNEKNNLVLNTEDVSLKAALFSFRTASQLIYGIDPLYSDFELIEHDSIFVLNPETNDLEKVGTLTEEERPIQNSKFVNAYGYEDEGYYGKHYPLAKTEKTATAPAKTEKSKDKKRPLSRYRPVTEKEKIFDDIILFMWETGLSLEDIDLLIYFLLGIPLCGCSLSDLATFVEHGIPVLKREYSRHKNLEKEWHRITTSSGVDPRDVIVENKLQFPWFLNDIKVLRELRKSEKNKKNPQTSMALVN